MIPTAFVGERPAGASGRSAASVCALVVAIGMISAAVIRAASITESEAALGAAHASHLW